MMDYEAQLKLQACLDGELPEAEAREVANWLARDEEAAGLYKELRQTRQALANSQGVILLPESREFYWSKIRREIERLEQMPRAPVRPPLLARLRRLLLPATAIALLTLVGVIATRSFSGHSLGSGVETFLADSESFTYRDYSDGTTLVWLSYPADN